MSLDIETKLIRKGYRVHFIYGDRVEIITKTKNVSSRINGEVTTDKNNYSADYIHRCMGFGIIKIYK